METTNPNITPEGNFKLTYLPYLPDAEPHALLEEAIQYLFDCWNYEEVYHPWTRKTKKRLLYVINNILLPACEEGNQDAIYWMFFAYMNGIGVEQDCEKALEYLTVIADYGYPDMQCELGKEYATLGWDDHQRGKNRIAARWFMKAAKQGNVEAMYWLGCCHQDRFGCRYNVRKAALWLKRAAERGHEEAAIELKYYKNRPRRPDWEFQNATSFEIDDPLCNTIKNEAEAEKPKE